MVVHKDIFFLDFLEEQKYVFMNITRTCETIDGWMDGWMDG
jgi:hypothetical protein